MATATYREAFDSTMYAQTFGANTSSVSDLLDTAQKALEQTFEALRVDIATAGHSEMPGQHVEIRYSAGPGGHDYAVNVTVKIEE